MTATAEADVQEFEEQRPLLFAIAYRMLGSATDAEDIVQDAYLRYQAVPRDEIRNERSYLVTIVSRLCLDYLKSARVQRESYIGPWPPSPSSPTTPTGASLPKASSTSASPCRWPSSSCSRASARRARRPPPARRFRLQPRRGRAGRRQVGSRLSPALEARRERVAERRPRQSLSTTRPASPSSSLRRRDRGRQGLIAVLAEDAIAYSDGGGKVAAALNPIYGADRVLRFGMGGLRKQMIDRIEVREVNGQPALLTWARDHLANIIFLQRDEAGKISRLYIQRNPDKLRRLRREMTAESGAASH
jgi:RNA polymerase sigma-70 factor (ECF subfamily)